MGRDRLQNLVAKLEARVRCVEQEKDHFLEDRDRLRDSILSLRIDLQTMVCRLNIEGDPFQELDLRKGIAAGCGGSAATNEASHVQ